MLLTPPRKLIIQRGWTGDGEYSTATCKLAVVDAVQFPARREALRSLSRYLDYPGLYHFTRRTGPSAPPCVYIGKSQSLAQRISAERLEDWTTVTAVRFLNEELTMHHDYVEPRWQQQAVAHGAILVTEKGNRVTGPISVSLNGSQAAPDRDAPPGPQREPEELLSDIAQLIEVLPERIVILDEPTIPIPRGYGLYERPASGYDVPAQAVMRLLDTAPPPPHDVTILRGSPAAKIPHKRYRENGYGHMRRALVADGAVGTFRRGQQKRDYYLRHVRLRDVDTPRGTPNDSQAAGGMISAARSQLSHIQWRLLMRGEDS